MPQHKKKSYPNSGEESENTAICDEEKNSTKITIKTLKV